MTVKELKVVLEALPDDMEVIIQKDSEGNGYSPLAGADHNAVYLPESTYSGDVHSTNWNASQVGMSEEEWAKIMEKPRALILFPIN